MKKLLIIFTLLFPLMFSSPSYSEWTKVSENVNRTSYYIDFERIIKQGGFVYYWELEDRLKPSKYGDLSSTAYIQGDCKLFRFKYLSDWYYTEPMGRGTTSSSSNIPDEEWNYPTPNSSGENNLKIVCSQ